MNQDDDNKVRQAIIEPLLKAVWTLKMPSGDTVEEVVKREDFKLWILVQQTIGPTNENPV